MDTGKIHVLETKEINEDNITLILYKVYAVDTEIQVRGFLKGKRALGKFRVTYDRVGVGDLIKRAQTDAGIAEAIQDVEDMSSKNYEMVLT